jgi:PAS domain-containing protein
VAAHRSSGNNAGREAEEGDDEPSSASAAARSFGDAALTGLYRRLIQAMTRPAEQTRLLTAVVDEAAGLARASAALLLPEPGDDAVLRMHLGTGILADREGELLPVEESFAGGAFRDAEPRVTADLSSDPRAFRLREHDAFAGPACALPLRHGSRPYGVLLVAREPFAAAFGPAELERLSAAAEAFAAAFAASARFHQARAGHESIDLWRRARDVEGWLHVRDAADRAARRVVVRWDPTHDRWQWGSTIRDVFGYEPEGFGDSADAWTEHLADAERESTRSEIRRALAEPLDLVLRFSLRHRGGAFRRAELHLFASAGEPFRAGLLCDVTEHGRANGEGEQQARADAVAEIVRGLRHEINNPLSVVLGQLQLLERDPTVLADPGLRDALRAMARESARIDELVRRLADLERQPREPFTTRAGGLNFPDQRR